MPSIQIIISFFVFAYIAAITPGPANLTSLATSLQYGKKAAFRQWTGIFIGFTIDSIVSVFLVYFVGTILIQYVKWFSLAGAVYLIYLSVHMLRQNYNTDVSNVKEPGFWRGIFVQLTNVKVMMSCITSLSSYILPNTQNFWVLFLFGALLPLTGPVCNLLWLFAGLSLQKLFVKHQKLINIIMAASLFACAVSLAIVPFTT